MLTILGPDVPAGTQVALFYVAAVCTTGGPPVRPFQAVTVHICARDFHGKVSVPLDVGLCLSATHRRSVSGKGVKTRTTGVMAEVPAN